MDLKKRMLLLLMAALPVLARAEVNCADGLDNDGDVAVDMEDNGCYSGGAITYVSAAGNDAWDGLSPVFTGGTNGPKQSLVAVAGLVNTLQPGQKLLFRRGDAWVSANPNGAIYVTSIQGTSTAPVTIGAYGTGSRPVFRQNLAGSTALTIRSSALGPSRWVVVRDLHLTTDIPHDDASPPTGVNVNDGVNPKPEHVVLNNMLIEELGFGIINYANDFTLENSIIRFNHNMGTPTTPRPFKQGFYTQADNAVIRNNEFERNGNYLDGFDHQIYVSNCQDVLIEGNRFHNSTDGVKLRQGRRLTVRNNEFYDLQWASIIAGGDSDGPQNDVVLTGNYIHDVGGGIMLRSQSGPGGHGLHNVVVSNNIFDNVTRVPNMMTNVLSIEQDIIENAQIHHNVFYNPVDNVKIWINNANPQGIRISNNVFHRSDNVRPQPWIDPTIIQIDSNPTLQGLTFANNLYHAENPGITILSVGSSDYTSLAAFRAAFPAQEAGGAEGDPGFADTANGDFHLTAASALAVDRGEPLASVLVDLDGSPRPQGSGFDIGAYERPGVIDSTPPAAPRGLRFW